MGVAVRVGVLLGAVVLVGRVVAVGVGATGVRVGVEAQPASTVIVPRWPSWGMQ